MSGTKLGAPLGKWGPSPEGYPLIEGELVLFPLPR